MKTQKTVLESEVLIQSEEVSMKDYRLEELEKSYGDLMEEILVEVFSCEGEDDFMDERSIYDLSSDEELEKRVKKEVELLNDGSAEVDDLTLLEKQARSYFDNPDYVFTPEEEIPVEWVTGFIQINAGLKFDKNGKPVEIWKSFGQKLICEADLLSSPEEVITRVEGLGIEWTEMVRVVFYGKSLEEYVGSRIYGKEEKKQLAPLCKEHDRILLAVPSYEECDSDESIFSRIDKMVKESIQYGSDLNLDRVALGHYELTLSRLEELKREELESVQDQRIVRFQKRSVERRNEFDAHFKEARETIKALNIGEVKVSQLFDKDSKFLGQVMYLCQKKGERIENPALFFQLKALANKRKCEEIQESSDSLMAIEVIAKINKGEVIEPHLLSFDELEEVFKVLWSGTGIRINTEHKSIYFKLKERFNHLKGVNKRNAA